MTDRPSSAALLELLEAMADQRRLALSKECAPVLSLAASYGELVCRAVDAMGRVAPASRQEEVVRDLIADTFDFLYEWPRPLIEGRTNVAWPLGRRAFESLSLACACYQDVAIAKKWDSGKELTNADIRRALSTAHFPEPADSLKEFYQMYSRGAHPSRDTIGERFLGNGNRFVLGSVGEPELVIVFEHCSRLVDMWYWFAAFVSYVAREALALWDPQFNKNYLTVAAEAASARAWVASRFKEVLALRQAELRAEGYS